MSIQIYDEAGLLRFHVDDRNTVGNTYCYMEVDFNTECSGYVTDILLVCLEEGGSGDIVFGIKIARYILNAFPSVRITILTQNRTILYTDPETDEIVEIDPKTVEIDPTTGTIDPKTVKIVENPPFKTIVEDFKHDHLKFAIDLRTGVEHKQLEEDGRVLVYNLGNPAVFYPNLPYRAMIVTPAVRNLPITFIGDNTNDVINRLQHNSYNFSEYNSPIRTETGLVSHGNYGPIGLLLNTYDEFYPLPALLETKLNGRRFAIAYFYADDDTVRNMPVPNEPNINKFSTYEHKVYYNLCIGLYSFILELHHYLLGCRPGEDICTEDIAVLVKHKVLDNLKSFLEGIGAQYNQEMNIQSIINTLDEQTQSRLRRLWQYLTDKRTTNPGLQLIDFCPLNKQDMLALYQRALPVVFISGDQSLSDFISVNNYFSHTIYYQVFTWKINFTRALTSIDYQCYPNNICIGPSVVTIDPTLLQSINDNPLGDFRLKGLKIINSLLVYSCKGRPQQNCVPFDQYATDDPVGVVEYATLVENLESHKVDILFEITEYPGAHNILLLTLNSDLLNKFTPLLMSGDNAGEYKANWLRGSTAANIHVKFIGYHVVPDIETCIRLSMPYIIDSDNIYTVPKLVTIVYMAHLINTFIRSYVTANFVYTYATIDARCIAAVNLPGVLIFTQFTPTTRKLTDFMQTSHWTVKNAAVVMFQLLWLLSVFNINAIVHNNLDNLDNVLIEYRPTEHTFQYPDVTDPQDLYGVKTRFIVKIVDFSNASFNMFLGNEVVRAASLSATQRAFDDQYDKKMLLSAIPLMERYADNPLTNLYYAVRTLVDYIKANPRIEKYPVTDFNALLEEKYDDVQHVL